MKTLKPKAARKTARCAICGKQKTTAKLVVVEFRREGLKMVCFDCAESVGTALYPEMHEVR